MKKDFLFANLCNNPFLEMKKSRRFLPKKRKRGKTFLACFYQTKKSIPATFLSSMCALGLKGWDLLPLCRSAHWWRIDDIDCDDNGEDNHNDDGDGIDGEDNDDDDNDRRFPSDEDEISQSDIESGSGVLKQIYLWNDCQLWKLQTAVLFPYQKHPSSLSNVNFGHIWVDWLLC